MPQREEHTIHSKYIAYSNVLERVHCWLLCLFRYFALPSNANIFPGNHFFARDIQTIPHLATDRNLFYTNKIWWLQNVIDYREKRDIIHFALKFKTVWFFMKEKTSINISIGESGSLNSIEYVWKIRFLCFSSSFQCISMWTCPFCISA